MPHHGRLYGARASAAVADYDGDGLTMSCHRFQRERKNRLYHNNGNFTFTDVAEKGVANGNDGENAGRRALARFQ
jgi:hypothetical protein